MRPTWPNKIGKYATLGLAEDTWALNEGVIDEGIFCSRPTTSMPSARACSLRPLTNCGPDAWSACSTPLTGFSTCSGVISSQTIRRHADPSAQITAMRLRSSINTTTG